MNSSSSNYGRILALDIGTSGARGAVFQPDGDVSATAAVSYSAEYGAGGFAELDPEILLQACVRVMVDCLRVSGPVDAVCPGAFMHALVLTDNDFRPLTRLSIWADRRATPQCEFARERFMAENWRARTGCPLSPSYPLYRLLWYREHQLELFDSFGLALSVKSFLLARLLGRPVEDASSASGTGLLNLRLGRWDPEILDFLGLGVERLPEIVPGHEPIVGAPTIERSEQSLEPLKELLGNARWLPGGADGPLAHLAGAGRSSDIMSLSIGTSMAARMSVSPEQWAGREQGSERRNSDTWCYILQDRHLVEGLARNNGGNVLEWYVKNQYPGGKLEDEGIVEGTAHVPGLMCVSELHQERAQDEQTVGFVMTGVRPEHTAPEKLRAVVEALAFQAVAMVEELTRGRSLRRIILSGSLTALPLVREILQSLLEAELVRVPGQNASLEGARLTALGELPDHGRDPSGPKKENAHTPNYRAKYERWKALRRALVAMPGNSGDGERKPAI